MMHVGCAKCGSSDAVGVYEDGHGYCFACGEVYGVGTFTGGREALEEDDLSGLVPLPRKRPDLPKSSGGDLLEGLSYRSLDKRRLAQSTCEKYGYGLGTYRGGIVQVAPYFDKTGKLVAQKVRTPSKDFLFLGNAKNATLFGQQICQGKGKMLVVTEGEIDCLSAYQALGGRWPVVSIRSGAGVDKGTVKVVRELMQQLDFLLGFEKVVLCFDMDEAGRQSAQAVAEALPIGTAHICQLPGGYKDANEMVVAGKERDLVSALFGAKQWRPDGVVGLLDPEVLEKIKHLPKMGLTYPWTGLNNKTFGLHPGQIHVIGAGSGTGKSVVCAEICVHLRKQGIKVGYVALEESVAMTGQRLAGILLNKPLYIPGDHNVSSEDIETALRSIGEDNGIVLYDHFGSLDTDIIFNRFRYMHASLGIQAIILDHLSIVISGQDDMTNERKQIDLLMTKLRSFTEETGMVIILVTHLARRQGQSYEEGADVTLASFRGSGAIGQLCDVAIGLERDQQAEDDDERDKTVIRVVKCRLGGRTGEACTLRYHHDTGRLTDVMLELVNEEGTSSPGGTEPAYY
jgi:twinkle protein